MYFKCFFHIIILSGCLKLKAIFQTKRLTYFFVVFRQPKVGQLIISSFSVSEQQCLKASFFELWLSHPLRITSSTALAKASLLFILYPLWYCYLLVHILCSFIHIYVQFHNLLPILTFFTCYFFLTLWSLNLLIILIVGSLTIESYNGRN